MSVLNCENGYKGGFCKYKEIIVGSGEKDHYQQFYPPAKKFLNKLIEEIDAKIVISSTWRIDGIDFMENVWKSEDMSGEIIGLTPNFRNANIPYTVPRGCEIDFWLKESGLRVVKWSKIKLAEFMAESDIENYIIIDDDSDMTEKQLKDNFVKTDMRTGFTWTHYDKAKKILKGEPKEKPDGYSITDMEKE